MLLQLRFNIKQLHFGAITAGDTWSQSHTECLCTFYAVIITRLGIFFDFSTVAFLRSFASVLSRLLFSFAAFISFGAVVRSCLICVGTRLWPCDCDDDGGLNHDALRIGTDSKYDLSSAKRGADSCESG